MENLEQILESLKNPTVPTSQAEFFSTHAFTLKPASSGKPEDIEVLGFPFRALPGELSSRIWFEATRDNNDKWSVFGHQEIGMEGRALNLTVTARDLKQDFIVSREGAEAHIADLEKRLQATNAVVADSAKDPSVGVDFNPVLPVLAA